MRVLIAVDGSAGSYEAVRQIAAVLAGDRDRVAIYYSPPQIRVSSDAGNPQLRSQAQQALIDDVFAEARKQLPNALQTDMHTIVGTLDARRGIVLAAAEWQADLIAVGARGLGRLERLLLGSVSRSVAHEAKVPVWVARPSRTAAEAGPRILLACEDPQSGQVLAQLLGKFTWPKGSTCQTVTVISSLFAGRLPDWIQQRPRSPEVEAMVQAWAHEHEEEVRSNVTRMREFARSLPGGMQVGEPLVAEGQPAEQILKLIGQQRCDLIAIGVKRKHSLADAIFGSTSEAVLSHAPCSVLVVPHHHAPS